MHGYAMSKDDLQRRVRRIEGQTRGIARMIAEDRNCVDILDQISAVDRALDQVALGLLRDHMSHCVTEAVGSNDAIDPQLDEITTAIARLLKS